MKSQLATVYCAIMCSLVNMILCFSSEPDFLYHEALSPYQPLAMKVCV